MKNIGLVPNWKTVYIYIYIYPGQFNFAIIIWDRSNITDYQ